MLGEKFFDQDACLLARALLGKVIRVQSPLGEGWLSAIIIETESYYRDEKASHASLGYTEKRKALFMPAGTIYMYYARGADSLNVSCRGQGNAVLIKAGFPFEDKKTAPDMVEIMRQLNPGTKNGCRAKEKLCAGQTLLCRSLGLRVVDWNKKQFDRRKFYMEDVNYFPSKIIQTMRLGIPQGRDEHLLYRFIDSSYADYCTANPLRKRAWLENRDYFITDSTG